MQLLGEPLNLSFEAIAQLTDKQIADVCHYPRDEQGRLARKRSGDVSNLPEASEEAMTPEERKQRQWVKLWSMGRAMGVPSETLREAWKRRYPEDG